MTCLQNQNEILGYKAALRGGLPLPPDRRNQQGHCGKKTRHPVGDRSAGAGFHLHSELILLHDIGAFIECKGWRLVGGKNVAAGVVGPTGRRCLRTGSRHIRIAVQRIGRDALHIRAVCSRRGVDRSVQVGCLHQLIPARRASTD
jgi:hypothetical protein